MSKTAVGYGVQCAATTFDVRNRPGAAIPAMYPLWSILVLEHYLCEPVRVQAGLS